MSDQTRKNIASKPHYTGHRERLRRRVLDRGGNALSDYEVIEFLLFGARPRGDMKPLAKDLMKVTDDHTIPVEVSSCLTAGIFS